VDLTRFAYRNRYTIQIEPGYYEEKIIVEANRPPITLRGMSDKTDAVLVQWFDCDGCVSPSDGVGEWYDQTLWVGANDFRTENISFAGSSRVGGRNMAMQVQADRAYFYNSRFYGDSSDTLYTGGTDHRAYFLECYINGTYDFLWGIGTAVFESTTIVGSDNIAAHKGTQVDRNGVLGGCKGTDLIGHSCTAYLMSNCRLPRPAGYTGHSTTLGRPWRLMATVLYKDCWMDDHISSAGWLMRFTESSSETKPAFNASVYSTPPPASKTMNLTFAEFNSSGPSAAKSRPAPAKIFTAEEAATWTTERLLKGWDPLTPSQQPY
jgi:pectinesterase